MKVFSHFHRKQTEMCRAKLQDILQSPMCRTTLCRTSRLFEHLGISPPAATAPAAAAGGVSGSREHRPEQQRHAAAGALLNGEQVQKLLSYRRFVRTAGFKGPREFVAGVKRRLAIEASQTFDEDGVTKSVAMAARRGDGARKRYRIASARARGGCVAHRKHGMAHGV